MEPDHGAQGGFSICMADTCLLGAYKLEYGIGVIWIGEGMATNRQAVVLHGHRRLLGGTSWCRTTSLCPFFWLSKVRRCSLPGGGWLALIAEKADP